MSAAPKPSTPPRRILVVEDDAAIRELLTRALTDAGYRVVTADHGVAALAQLHDAPVDLMLLDVWMPHMNGLELLARLREEKSPPRVIMMTGDNTPTTVVQAVRDNAYHYVHKPFSTKDVVELVGQVLGQPEDTENIQVVSAKPDWLELLVPCKREIVDRIQSFLMHLETDLPVEVRESVGHAFRELLLNAIEWGGHLDPHQRVRISSLRTKRMVLYRIADPGHGFRFDEIPHAAVSNPPGKVLDHMEVRQQRGLRPGGFGILLTRSVVDELIYNEAQNEVIFVKYLEK